MSQQKQSQHPKGHTPVRAPTYTAPTTNIRIEAFASFPPVNGGALRGIYGQPLPAHVLSSNNHVATYTAPRTNARMEAVSSFPAVHGGTPRGIYGQPLPARALAFSSAIQEDENGDEEDEEGDEDEGRASQENDLLGEEEKEEEIEEGEEGEVDDTPFGLQPFYVAQPVYVPDFDDDEDDVEEEKEDNGEEEGGKGGNGEQDREGAR